MTSTQTGCKLNQLSPTTHPDPTENKDYDKLYHVAKQMYKKYTMLKRQVRQREQQQLDHLRLMRKKYTTLKVQHRHLQNKHKLIKMYYTDVKTKLEEQKRQQQQQQQGQQEESEEQGTTTATTTTASSSGRATCTQQ